MTKQKHDQGFDPMHNLSGFAASMPPELAGNTDGPAPDMRREDIKSGDGHGFSGFIGTSPPMQRVYARIEASAQSRAPVFITGESGTGKEICARAIHDLGPGKYKAFVPINCAAIPRELMESELFGHVKGAFTGAISTREGAASLADGGTLFLDEITEMPNAMQTKLLRFLQDFTYQKVGSGKVESSDFRLICASNRDPLTELKAGRFREDLYYRLHVFPIHMPPLRERGQDILDISDVLLRRYAKEEGKMFRSLGKQAAAHICRYHWPGNIRELQNIIRNAVIMHDGEILLPDMLSIAEDRQAFEVSGTGDDMPLQTLETLERMAIEKAIRHFGGNVPKAAAVLGVSPSTVYRKRQGWR